MHHLMFVTVCVIWGSSFILMREAYVAFGPLSIAAGRVIGGGGVLLALWFVRPRRWPLGWRDLPALGLSVVLGYVLPFTLQPHLIGKHGNSSFFGMMVALVPLMTILVSVPMLRVRPTARQVIGVTGGLICMATLSLAGKELNIGIGDFLLACMVPLGYSISNTWVKRRFSSAPAMALVASLCLLSALVLTPLGIATETVHDVQPRAVWLAVAMVAFLGIVGTGIAPWIFYRLIQARGPLYAGMVTYVVPIGALVFGWIGHERITAVQVAALVGILAMVGLVQFEGKGGSKESDEATKGEEEVT